MESTPSISVGSPHPPPPQFATTTITTSAKKAHMLSLPYLAFITPPLRGETSASSPYFCFYSSLTCTLSTQTAPSPG